jgi:hypothetical protein
MSKDEVKVSQTQHAFLVAWGQFAQEIGLIEAIQSVQLKQKKYNHRPQTKVLEFFVAHLAGLKHLQDISLSAHPLDKDEAVARAWGQEGWADYSGISRTLSRLSWAEAHEIVQALQVVSHPFLEKELQQVRAAGQKLWYDGDLSGLPVSDNSSTFPNAAFGHMADDIRLGYQAAVVSVQGMTYRRLWLSVAHHSGDTVSCTQAEAMVEAAEAGTGLRPWRRIDLLGQRIQAFEAQRAVTQQRRQKQQAVVAAIQTTLAELSDLTRKQQQVVTELENQYQTRHSPERPTSQLAKARARLPIIQRKQVRHQMRLLAAQKRLAKTEALWQQQEADCASLQQRLTRLAQDNATNPAPIKAVFRLDAGFGTYENIALLIEMGYEVYTKPYSHRVVKHLQDKVSDQATWIRVGKNAAMVAWTNYQLKGCPYPLDVALQRFYTGKTVRYSGLFHFGDDPVTQHLPTWFDTYNGRQTIEAGIKEGKQVFHLHRLKVRSEPAIYLQEHFVILAANFIRWATHWLAQQALPLENALNVATLGVKKQVQVAAHVSADVVWHSDGWLLRFSQYSAFAGKVLKLPGGVVTSPLCSQKNAIFMPFSMKSHLIAQPLR